ncbi:hypothetical protein NQ314_017763 [Rhamnusium bicolor]|uniref:Uncharacterized protein n=1 Tax=Rhamnusium bicolor TaxID=1586634 RepID=A0AAV8WTE7_9CUCU|nr:hypothetical protein NQ314_017763 [Rhamnusium bicolor]
MVGRKRKHKIVRKPYSSDDECKEQESTRPPPIKRTYLAPIVLSLDGKALVSHVKEQNDQILTWIAKQNQKSTNNTEFGILDIPFSFPVQTIEELDELNAYVNDSNDKFTTLASGLATLGAVKRGVPNSTDKDIEDVMKVWLRHTRERF